MKISREQYDEISKEIIAELLEKQRENMSENIRKCDLTGDGFFDLKGAMVFLLSESAKFTVDYVNEILKAVLGFSE